MTAARKTTSRDIEESVKFAAAGIRLAGGTFTPADEAAARGVASGTRTPEEEVAAFRRELGY
ncbi:hypothetical protein G9444_0062 [Rhodococcus erythropolis]|jgi:hypothetical protein|uniref:Antitoxin VbhA domain-containing protein n=1 Tax=Rhodococcus erythropolis TaxID=1833 RepID=A0A6G9CKT5_RHOER|nr:MULTISPECIES: hypothetical protein [Rhodococcus]MCJ0900235.1 hypothetical protein [Rhodococcus sp. ARC_M13]OFE09756.1 hypothetical protein A5N83_06095 [Rhodococcus sp. 1139]QIP37306.1 hypothetical protein G9444_0062 [Rhodococcus erythropolis]UGQ51181.1 hypothetical protein LRL17_24665 [Rhodococcus qingshengii]UKO86700.1 hypothetical protein ITJ47_02455 [Rhodococcus erythropolis]